MYIQYPISRRSLASVSLRLFAIIAILFLLLSSGVLAQKTAVYDNPLLSYQLGMELFEKQKFGAAQKAFTEAIEDIESPNSDLRVNAEYYQALCALELFNKDAEFLLGRFIENHSENPKVRTAYFQLGIYKFRKKSYTKAIEWFNKVDIYDLNNKQLSEYYFKLAYSYFVKKENERARKLFYEIKDAKTKYSNPAIYYYSHISYLNQSYETALQGFLKLSTNGSFQNIVPYYIAQIYYMQKKHEKLVEYALPLLDSANTKRAPEIARLIGEAYYATDKYEESIPYLKRYMEQGHHAQRADLYQLGYAYYKIGDYSNAIGRLKQVVNTKDELAQNSYYHLGECYLKKGEKKFARFAFRSASKLEYDVKMQEDAAYNYAKLSYDLNLNPIFAITKYIATYPNAGRKDEAYEYLVKVYLNTKNYKRALKALDKIENKSESLETAYQRIAYYRGVELFNDKKIPQALHFFDAALNYPNNANIEALCHYWKGESYYRLKKFAMAIENYDKFIYAPAAFGLPNFNLINYNMGYAYFKLEDYKNANTWLRKYVRHLTPTFERRRSKFGDKNEVFSRMGDAHLRIGDTYFVTKDYQGAIEHYELAIGLLPDSLSQKGLVLADVDYGTFQKGLAFGVLGKPKDKITSMRLLMNDFPQSIYLDDAKYELAKSYTVLNQTDSAITWYQNIIDEHSASSYVKKSMLNMGLEYYNKNENEIALVTFKRVIRDYPASPVAREALVGIKNIYIALGDVDAYEKFVGGLSFANITKGSLDSITYEAAEHSYMNGDCSSAMSSFDKYLEKFSDGYFELNSSFYLAECLNRVGDSASLAKALTLYEHVIASARSAFTEKSLLNAAAIQYAIHEYNKAIASYEQLEQIAEYKSNIIEARIGQMRCEFLLKNYADAITAAEKVLETGKVSNEALNESHFIIAKSSLETDDYNLALKEFKATSAATRSEMGAAAQYYVAYIQYLRSEHDSSEQSILVLARRVPSYDNWVAKGFILLADNYLQMDNAFQAKATLQSVIDNHNNEELIEIATEKIEQIKVEEELKKQKQTEYDDLEIKFEEYDIQYDKLYEGDEDEEDEEDEEEEMNDDKQKDEQEEPEEEPQKEQNDEK